LPDSVALGPAEVAQQLRSSSRRAIVKVQPFPSSENDIMRTSLSHSLTLAFLFGFASAASAKQPLELTDPGLQLQELRPLDRRVYVLTLEGKWNEPASAKETYYVNLLFPDGGSYSHRALEKEMFRKGEVRCVIQGYQLVRHSVDRDGKFTIVVSAGQGVGSVKAPEVISNSFEVSWPMDRFVSRYRPRSRFSEPEDVDAFPIPGEKPPPAKRSRRDVLDRWYIQPSDAGFKERFEKARPEPEKGFGGSEPLPTELPEKIQQKPKPAKPDK
jgi:hypothetical protein